MTILRIDDKESKAIKTARNMHQDTRRENKRVMRPSTQ
jgi:hypothetical protein